MNLYAYCLSDEETAATLAGLAGVGGGKVRVVDCGGLAAVVSDFAEAKVAVTRENVAAHNGVVGAVLARATPLPFRFGTVAGAAQLAAYVAANETSLRGALARVRGCVEMSVKIIWDAEGVRRREAEESGSDAGGEQREASQVVAGVAGGDGGGGGGGGAAYLAAKRREIVGGERMQEHAEELAAWLAGRVGEAARESKVDVRPEQSLVVRAAHLVERARLEDYRARVQAAREERATDLRFLTSGAWPPYSFTST